MNPIPILRKPLAWLLMFASFSWMMPPAWSAPLSISDNPLFLTANVAPNVVVTLDDSGSMARAFTPDLCGNNSVLCSSGDLWKLDGRYLKSSHYNPIYYNPTVTYDAPVNSSGTKLTTSFNHAWINGYATTLDINGDGVADYYDLATEYRPTAGLSLNSGGSKTHQFMNHYTAGADFTQTVSYTLHTHNGTTQGTNTSSNAPYFTITDYVNQDGSGSGNDPGSNLRSVVVNGTSLNDAGTFTLPCTNNNDPASGGFKTNISGSTLTLCFKDETGMYGKTAVVTHKTAGSSVQSIEPTDPTAAYYYVFDGTNTDCTGTDAQKKVDNECYDLKIVSTTSGADRNGDGSISTAEADERQNFANWYSFYRTRNLATIASASLAFTELDETTRVAWQALTGCKGSTGLVTTDCEGWETTSTNFSNAIKPFSSTHRQNFYAWLFRLNTDSTTPLREAMIRAGQYFSTTGENSPYDDNLLAAGTVSGTTGQLSCRKNFHILMTDGVWTDSTISGLSDVDSGLTAPYKGTTDTSLSDVAYTYWSTDLTQNATTDLADNLLPYIVESGAEPGQSNNPKNDPATWQHMVNFTVGLGLTPFLADAGLTYNGSTYSGSYPGIAAGSTPWPSTSSAVQATKDGAKVADLWHAAINSRGQFFSADSPDSLVTAFKAVRNAIETATPSAAALAANSTSIQTGALVYQATFNSKDWSGDLIAYPVQFGGRIGDPAWSAASKLPAAADRKIYTINGSNGADFSWGALSSDQQTSLNKDAAGTVDTSGSDRLDWLRGVQTKEIVTDSNGNVVSGVFRKRSSLLGDIINSDPVFAQAEDFGYTDLQGDEAGTYAAYVMGKSSRTAAVFVGGNDGMLHTFQAGGVNAGKELFAYVPNGVYANLSKLPDPAYVHKYFVDGGPTVGDAYLSNAWKTVLVGGLGAGGKSIYALDVSNVANPTASSTVMWEFTDADLGLTYSKPQIARLDNGQWVAIFGNGYNSDSSTGGRAYLYVVNLETGALIAKFAAGTATANGLSTPVLFDAAADRINVGTDKIVDYAYAGDLQGNLWKFDLTGFASDATGLSFAVDTPLFIARNSLSQVQPITAQPIIGGHPNGGVLVYFGTGQYLQSGDIGTAFGNQVQSFYAVWDKGGAVATIDRAQLQAQTITARTTEFGMDVRETSKNPVSWDSQFGWYMDLDQATGERVVSQALLRYGRVIFLTVIPSTDTCDAGGVSWLMEVDAMQGGRTNESSFDFNNDGVFDSSDALASGATASGVKTTVGITKPPAWFTGEGGKDFKVMTGTSGSIQSLGNKGGAAAPGTLYRTYWQQIQ